MSWRADCQEAGPNGQWPPICYCSSLQYQEHLLAETFCLKSWHLKRLWAKGFKLTTSKNLTTNSSPAARLSLTWSIPTSHHYALPSDFTFVLSFVFLFSSLFLALTWKNPIFKLSNMKKKNTSLPPFDQRLCQLYFGGRDIIEFFLMSYMRRYF